jgi:hypothetical protein
MKRMPRLGLRDFVRTETTHDLATGKRLIEQILDDPTQRRQVMAMADAMVPALPRFDGVINDLSVQQHLDELPLVRSSHPPLASAAGTTATSATSTRPTPPRGSLTPS